MVRPSQVACASPGRGPSQGHDFVISTRTNEAWTTTKAAGAKLGGGAFGVLAKLAEALVIQRARDMGFPI